MKQRGEWRRKGERGERGVSKACASAAAALKAKRCRKQGTWLRCYANCMHGKGLLRGSVPHVLRRPITPWCAKCTWAGSKRFSTRDSYPTGRSRMYLWWQARKRWGWHAMKEGNLYFPVPQVTDQGRGNCADLQVLASTLLDQGFVLCGHDAHACIPGRRGGGWWG